MIRFQHNRMSAVWAVAGLIVLCWTSFIYANVVDYSRISRHGVSSRGVSTRQSDEDLSWRDSITFSPAHQNPAKAPAVPIPDVETTVLASNQINNSISTFNSRGLHVFEKRDALRCDNGICNDDRFVISSPPPFSGRHISDIGTTVAVARIISADMGRTSVAMAAKPTARLLPCAESIARMRICRAA